MGLVGDVTINGGWAGNIDNAGLSALLPMYNGGGNLVSMDGTHLLKTE